MKATTENKGMKNTKAVSEVVSKPRKSPLKSVKMIAKKPTLRLRFRPMAKGKQMVCLDTYGYGKRSIVGLKLYLLPGTDDATARQNAATMKKAEAILKKRQKEVNAELKELRKEVLEQSSSYEEAAPDEMRLCEWMDVYYKLQQSHGVRDLSLIKTAKNKLLSFNPNVRLKDIGRKFCLDFVAFLESKSASTVVERLSPKTGFNILGELRTALNVAVRSGILPSNPFTKLAPHEKIHVPESRREYLTIGEIKQLIDTPCDSKVVKQVFLFACNCGLRPGDIRALKWKDITKDGDKWRLATVMAKTKRPIFLPLCEQAVRWLPEKSTAADEDSVFSDMPKGEELNRELKAWVKAAGITKRVEMYTARHSFATMLLTLGADLYTVSKLLGHTSIRHTQRYAKVIDAKKDEAVNLVNNLF